MSARQPAARHLHADDVTGGPLVVNLPPAVVEQADFWTGTGRFATGSGLTEWTARRAGDGKPVLILVAKDDPLSPSVQVLLQLRDRVTEFAHRMEADADVVMRAAGARLLAIVEGADDAA